MIMDESYTYGTAVQNPYVGNVEGRLLPDFSLRVLINRCFFYVESQ